MIKDKCLGLHSDAETNIEEMLSQLGDVDNLHASDVDGSLAILVNTMLASDLPLSGGQKNDDELVADDVIPCLPRYGMLEVNSLPLF